MKIKRLALLIVALPVISCFNNSAQDSKISVKWLNYDGTVLLVEKYNKGDIPEYKGETPTREKDVQYTYTFSGWSPEITEAVKKISYTAQYETELNTYTINWENDDGTNLSSETYYYGETPQYNGDTPEKESEDSEYFYKFVGWEETITPVNGDKTYTAKYEYSQCFEFELYENIYYKIKKCNMSTSKNIVVPDRYNGLEIVAVDLGAFNSCTSVETLTLPFVGTKKKISPGAIYTHLGYLFGAEAYTDNNNYVPRSLKHIVLTNECTTIKSGTFYGLSSLEMVDIPSSVTTIYDGFEECSCSINYYGSPSSWLALNGRNSLTQDVHLYFDGDKETTDFIVPNDITTLDAFAFYGCSYLKYVTIPSNITSIEWRAFAYTANNLEINYKGSMGNWDALLGKEYLPQRIHLFFNGDVETTSLVISYPFTSFNLQGCIGIESVSIGPNVSSINCQGCSSLSTFIVDEGNTYFSVENGALLRQNKTILCYVPADCDEFSIPSSVQTFESYAFSNCQNLATLHIPSTVTDGKLINDCKSLTTIYFDEGITTIGDFKNCPHLTTVYLPSTINEFSAVYFNNCPLLSNVYIDDNNQYYCSENGVVYNKNKTEIIFYPSASGDIYLPSTIQAIGAYAFRDCVNLNSVHFTSSVVSIGASPFRGCTCELYYRGTIETWLLLKNKNNITNIHLFLNGDSETTSIIIPNGTTVIDNYDFYCCMSITSVSFPNTLQAINQRAFSGCKSLLSIIIPESVNSVGEYAFYNCKSLLSIIIPESVNSVGKYAFYGCSSLANISIQSVNVVFGDNVFSGCNSVLSLELTFIGKERSSYDKDYLGYLFGAPNESNNAKYIPSTLKRIIVSDSCTYLGNGAFSGCSSIESITLPFVGISPSESSAQEYNKLRVIFGNSIPSSLKQIILSESCSSLNSASAFEGCGSITSIVIPSSFDKTWRYAFNSLTSVNCVYFHGTFDQYVAKEITAFSINIVKYYSETQPTDSGNYWHYVDGVPTLW